MPKNPNWQKVRLREILTHVEDLVPLQDFREYITITVKRRHGGLEPRERSFGHEIKTKKQYRLIPGAFLISRVQCWHQAYAMVPEDVPENMIASQNYDQFIISSKVDGRFFWWFSHSPLFTETVRSSAFGVVIEKMVFNREAWLDKPIPLPPLDEQRHIVARIEELATKVDQIRGLRRKAQDETRALFTRILKSEFERFHDQTTTIGDAFKVTTGGTPSRGNPAFWHGDVKWISSGEVAFEDVFDTNEKITQVGVAGSNAKVYPPNTVLIAMIGQGKTRGQCAILRCHAATNQNVAGIHVHATIHKPEYVYWWLLSRYQESRSSEIGTAQPALSGQRVKQMPIPLPSPNHQAMVVKRLQNSSRNNEALTKLQNATAAEIDAIMPSILSKAFRGEL